ncbi:MAG: thymidine phosphorylase [Bacteroidales bacterium]|nr:thymidine phosphorylase [Clostridium sp.]MCM1203027.1 thymidine phosphorylase [Bacteroidales bacterium]
MNTYDIIMKKRDGYALEKEEIIYLVNGFTKGEIPDYQMSAFLMAVYFRGMNPEETTNLTMAMADSGDRLDLSGINGIKVDKHSTGGVGDKTSLVVGPILASLGVPVAKMSGRGLGHTGGTIDKLEGIPGFRTDIPEKAFIEQVNHVGLAIVGQTANLAPADKKIYALRDVTATVDNISLIAASIMSKKLAAGADAIVLDVKVGSGAFMKTLEEAEKLAKTMVAIGTLAGRDTTAVITDMNEPLGNAVGNILEVEEAVECLNGKGEKRLTAVSKTLAGHMLLAAKKAGTKEEAEAMVEEAVVSGKALEKMKEFVAAQGGEVSCLTGEKPFKQAALQEKVTGEDLLRKEEAEEAGKLMDKAYLVSCDNQEIGMVSLVLGGGRQTKDSVIDLTVGLRLNKHLGDVVAGDDVVATLYANDAAKLEEAKKRFVGAYRLSADKPMSNPIIYEVITKDNL